MGVVIAINIDFTMGDNYWEIYIHDDYKIKHKRYGFLLILGVDVSYLL